MSVDQALLHYFDTSERGKHSSQHYFSMANTHHNITFRWQTLITTLLFDDKHSSQHYFSMANTHHNITFRWQTLITTLLFDIT